MAALLVVGCTPSRYQHQQDFTPPDIPVGEAIQEPEVVSEPKSSLGNTPVYEVRGETYTLIEDAKDYKETGKASWYGMKFHGHKTSNGETFDVYKMTAAHKTLPLPSIVKVTKVDEPEKTVVVRVNDRGPFHEDRIIDLSYAAAVKLGVDKDGVANVDIEVLAAPKNYSVKWVQIVATKHLAQAIKIKKKLVELQKHPVIISTTKDGAINKVRIGPVKDGADMDELKELLNTSGYIQTVVLGKHQL